jgi:rubredoxin
MMSRYICDSCGWMYDPEFGVLELDVDPGIPFEDLPDDFECPECGVGKLDFSQEE